MPRDRLLVARARLVLRNWARGCCPRHCLFSMLRGRLLALARARSARLPRIPPVDGWFLPRPSRPPRAALVGFCPARSGARVAWSSAFSRSTRYARGRLLSIRPHPPRLLVIYPAAHGGGAKAHPPGWVALTPPGGAKGCSVTPLIVIRFLSLSQ